MNILHTADWHLGRTLYGQRRDDEFSAFLDWLLDTIVEHHIDVLLIAGDVFDTTTPSNRAQAQYYDFLHRAAASCCQHIVITGGNHDSPTFLDAPQALLKSLNVYVTGQATDDPADEVITLHDANGEPVLIVCAVPYLRDRDIRTANAGESTADKAENIINGIREHYAAVSAIAEEARKSLDADIPVIAMGHLFTAGGQTTDDDGVRELYIGTLGHVSGCIFPSQLDYVALGHLHVPQIVGGNPHIRYSGSPIAMGFGEAKQQKSLCLLHTQGRKIEHSLIPVPCFQSLASIKGDWPAITTQLHTLIAADSNAWLEIIYNGDKIASDLRQRLDDLSANSKLRILRIKNTRINQAALSQQHSQETLADLDVYDVFERRLAASAPLSDDEQNALRDTYQEALTSFYEQDTAE
ncbi:exonuclease SbcCD subunit D C-terminal domain-containing protein [Cardiobacteriaceae bacterium TAE3-ERU3]|nr:exonuclease SbcCD subunit D C-terminal domain-containing protein [Cardiobacteriaceae bacterium TAE3-ERU3]